MIARIWHGTVQTDRSEDYHRYLLDTGLKDYSNTKGNRGVYLLRKLEGNQSHFITLTFWSDLKAIRNFAGNDIRKAKYYPDDNLYLLQEEPFVEHFEIIESFNFQEPTFQAENSRAELFFERPILFYK